MYKLWIIKKQTYKKRTYKKWRYKKNELIRNAPGFWGRGTGFESGAAEKSQGRQGNLPPRQRSLKQINIVMLLTTNSWHRYRNVVWWSRIFGFQILNCSGAESEHFLVGSRLRPLAPSVGFKFTSTKCPEQTVRSQQLAVQWKDGYYF